MGLLSGSASITRYRVVQVPSEPDFERARFFEIQPGSEVRESIGFVPFEPDAPYAVGTRRWAFRVRIDRLRPDPVAVRERVRDLVRLELETGAEVVGPKRRRQLKQLAEEELIVKSTPRSKIVEACIDGDVLYVGTTAKNTLGLVVQQLRAIDVDVEPSAPWLDRGEPEVESEFVTLREPGQSIRGCWLLAALVGDPEVMVEPVAGNVRLQTRDARITLAGGVMKDLLEYLERDAVLLSAKLLTADAASFRFDAASFRISTLKVEIGAHEHWTELLDERLERIAAVFELLERKYEELEPGAGKAEKR